MIPVALCTVVPIVHVSLVLTAVGRGDADVVLPIRRGIDFDLVY